MQGREAGGGAAWGLNIWLSSREKKEKLQDVVKNVHARVHKYEKHSSALYLSYQMTTSCASDPWPCFTAAPWTPVGTQTPLELLVFHTCYASTLSIAFFPITRRIAPKFTYGKKKKNVMEKHLNLGKPLKCG